MKKGLLVIFCLLLAILFGYTLPNYLNLNKQTIAADIKNEVALVKQNILSYENNEKDYYKLYANGKLVGVVNNLNYLNTQIDQKYQKDYLSSYPDTSLTYGENVYLVKESSYANFENIDDQIFTYLVANDLLGLKTTAIDFYTSGGVFDIIYVKDINDFANALDRFLLNFLSQDTLNKIRTNTKIADPSELGSVEFSYSIFEKIRTSEAVCSPEEIFNDENQIYEYLCYGRNPEREYYTTNEGDTLQGVGFFNDNMTAKQLMMINPGLLSSENQVITPGMRLNVTYYTSPITVEVIKKNLSQQFIMPEVPEYIDDDSLESGVTEVVVQEEVGIKNVLYKETWINGVLQDGEMENETVIKQPIRGLIKVGTKVEPFVGTGNYVWPVDNPRISCGWGCYTNHTGVDFINSYETYGAAHAVDSGIVVSTGYRYDMGNYVMIDHQNGIKTTYMHLNVPAYVDEGQTVTRNQIIGQIGNTGVSFGAHLHLAFEVGGTRVDPCFYMPCDLLR